MVAFDHDLFALDRQAVEYFARLRASSVAVIVFKADLQKSDIIRLYDDQNIGESGDQTARSGWKILASFLSERPAYVPNLVSVRRHESSRDCLTQLAAANIMATEYQTGEKIPPRRAL